MKEYGIYHEVRWRQYWERVRNVGLALLELGVRRGDRVAIMGDPCPAWGYGDLGAQAIGAITYGIYATSAPSQVRYVLQDGGASVVIAEDQEHVDKILAVADDVPALQTIVVVDSRGMFDYRDRRLRAFADVEALGRAFGEREPDRFDAEIADGDPEDVAFLVYTSGTSGPPKPAMLRHENCLTALVGSFGEIFPALLSDQHRTVSFLSMAHILERALTLYLPLAYDVIPHYGESVDAVGETLFETQPTFFCGVPRVWEKIASQVLVAVQSSSPLKRVAYRLALAVRATALRRRWRGAPPPPWLAVGAWLALVLVFRHILRKVGLGRVRYALATGAPLPPRIQELWQMWGVDLVNLYGATEAGGVITSQRPGFPRAGDVGMPTSVNTVRLDADGEVLVQGPGVFAGYWGNQVATQEAVRDGWLHVGEVGVWDDGRLKIVDRKRDIMVTAGGKNLAPTNIENALKASPYISEAVVFAEGRRYPVALIEIDAATVAEWARAHSVVYTDFASLVEHPRVRELLDGEIRLANAELARVEQVKQFRILPKELDPENEDDPLTPTRKVKRALMYERFRDLVESMFTSEAAELLDTTLTPAAEEQPASRGGTS